ncbi:MAG: hypothetical protein AB7E55_18735 [Pigmentiphaga sp.]
MTDFYPPFTCDTSGCENRATFGYGWSGRRQKRGRWYCVECDSKRQAAASKPVEASRVEPASTPAPPRQGSLI